MKRLLLFFALMLAVPSYGQNPTASVIPAVKSQWLDSSGNPLASGTLRFYEAGTVTPLNAYTTYTQTGSFNTLTLDAAGRGNVFLGPSCYKVIAENVLGTQQWSVDGVCDLALLQTLSFATKMDDKVCHASQYTGTSPNDSGGKLVACIAVLPSTGGTVAMSGLEGAQAWSTCPFTGVTKPVQVIMGVGTTTLSVSCTVPSSVSLVMGAGSIVSVNTGLTLTITGAADLSLNQHFAGSGTVVFGGATGSSASPAITYAYPQWWGAKADGTTNDLAALHSAFAASKFVRGTGQYRIATPLTIPQAASFSGPLPGNSQNFMAVRCDATMGFTGNTCVTTSTPAGGYINIEGLTINTIAMNNASYVAFSVTGMSETSTIKNISFYTEASAAGQEISKLFYFNTFGPLKIETMNITYPGPTNTTNVLLNPIDIYANGGLVMNDINYTVTSPESIKIICSLYCDLSAWQIESHPSVAGEPSIELFTATDGVSFRDSRITTAVANSMGVRLVLDSSPQRSGYVLENITVNTVPGGGTWDTVVSLCNIALTCRSYNRARLVTASSASDPFRIMRFTPDQQLFGGTDTNLSAHRFVDTFLYTAILTTATKDVPFNPRVLTGTFGIADMTLTITARRNGAPTANAAKIFLTFVDGGGTMVMSTPVYLAGSAANWTVAYTSPNEYITITNADADQMAQVIVTVEHVSFGVWP